MSEQIEQGMKVEVFGEEGVFVVGELVHKDENSLKTVYNLIDEKGVEGWTEVADMLPTVGSRFDIDWQERYDIICPYCEHEMPSAPSLFHQLGHISMGCGSCTKCNKAFAIQFNPFANRMLARSTVF